MENSVRVRVHRPTRRGILVELSGEFEVGTRRVLGRTLDSVASWGQPVFVDLSGVTFMDSSCLWELVVQHRLHRDRLALCNPSPQVELSVAACDLEGWITFHPSKDLYLKQPASYPRRPGRGVSTPQRAQGARGYLINARYGSAGRPTSRFGGEGRKVGRLERHRRLHSLKQDGPTRPRCPARRTGVA